MCVCGCVWVCQGAWRKRNSTFLFLSSIHSNNVKSFDDGSQVCFFRISESNEGRKFAAPFKYISSTCLSMPCRYIHILYICVWVDVVFATCPFPFPNLFPLIQYFSGCCFLPLWHNAFIIIEILVRQLEMLCMFTRREKQRRKFWLSWTEDVCAQQMFSSLHSLICIEQ